MALKKYLINDVTHHYDFVHDKENLTVSDIENPSALLVSNIHIDKTTGFIFFSAHGKTYKAHIEVKTEDNNKYTTVSFAHTQQQICIEHIQQKPELKKSPSIRQQENVQGNVPANFILKSPLAGRINNILIVQGQEVTKGQTLLRIESMKMENEICSPHTAIIKTILIMVGNVVQPNQILIEFEKKGDNHAAPKNPDGQEAVSHR